MTAFYITVMFSPLGNARFLLLIYAAAEALLGWSLRFLPRPIKSKLASGMLAIFVGAAFFAVIAGELLQYSAATGHVPLKDDKFFVPVFFIQHGIAIIIMLNSDSAARRKEKASRVSNS
jgi:hypothetical protein